MMDTSNMHADLKKRKAHNHTGHRITVLCEAQAVGKSLLKGRTPGVAQKGRQELEWLCDGGQRSIAGRQPA